MYVIPNLTFHNSTKVDYEMVRVDTKSDLAKSFLELFSLWISHRIAEPGHHDSVVRMRRRMKVNFDGDDKDKSEV